MKKIDEWSEYFSTHCYLPAGAIQDLFDEIERLQRQSDAWQEDAKRYCRTAEHWQSKVERLLEIIDRVALIRLNLELENIKLQAIADEAEDIQCGRRY